MYDVLIIGGGLSGLAAGVKLASEGLRVSLFERKHYLGGRCYSYEDTKIGEIVDNGQHVLIGAYHQLLHYLDIIETKHYLRKESHLRLPLFHPQKGFTDFHIKYLPKPFNLINGIFGFPFLSETEKIRMIKLGIKIWKSSNEHEENLSNMTISQWLDENKQSDTAKRNFWYPVAVSIMNEIPERASALLFFRSLKKALFGNTSDSAILIPKVNQYELYAQNAITYLKRRRCNVNLNAEVHSIMIKGNKVTGIKLSDNKIVKCKTVICAVPYYNVIRLIPEYFHECEPFLNFVKFEPSPIISYHLWFENAFTDVDYVGCIDFNLQWIFNRRVIFGEQAKKPFYITCVISGAHKYINLKKDELIKIALADLYKIFPESRNSRLVRSTIIKERRATFSATPDTEKIRPSTKTPIQGFFLAGDWTDTGLPATIEGAVLSGFRAADIAKTF